ncbi:zinc finger domain-containing protein [Thermochaetoides thermophila DSM 1495]|uniref:Zinc finger domain-containing protein n=1 Tax=Chaetomium thermophilum (strain DSM 1495 / CBS 144.50 / IMI 039719) TaxID=759272 RepID=G0SB32_CHATD|nr:zinc finger domain-containing protein [Thermochaetoides thermophila DSM 1495]8PV1_Cb Chain Cb, Zinc finger domain-containing protein [Thermochaetoides thermophila DSM 1495]8PV2_Cb Chain Cb, Zinc finger domain-containing protein [Thermochaetoides thermophila DSM 1495]8PV3_Cb Chain Cb, Zinc finger domain-containing protein [Thermochaetoides thermophila DSM 1495]8PV4_Cb Chain Cb, Zinc finger domain-containing protein [Thermochaetoides thermophila DSM 1495]8PV5_Cb Chain Cb, Zinc finger domain-c
MGVFAKRTMTKTRRRLRDLDQIERDLRSPRHLQQYKETKAAEDLPGLGLYYCIECAKWFESETSLVGHRKGKPHKRRLKQLKEGAYTHEEAMAAIGYRIDNGKKTTEQPKTQDVEMS